MWHGFTPHPFLWLSTVLLDVPYYVCPFTLDGHFVCLIFWLLWIMLLGDLKKRHMNSFYVFSKFLLYIYLLVCDICVWAQVRACVHVRRSETTFRSRFSPSTVSSRDWTQVVRLEWRRPLHAAVFCVQVFAWNTNFIHHGLHLGGNCWVSCGNSTFNVLKTCHTVFQSNWTM